MEHEPFVIGNYIHIYNRGNRKMPIFYDENDKWRFLRSLRYFNDKYSPENLFRNLSYNKNTSINRQFDWQKNWPEHKPLVKILCFCLMPNHFHILLQETQKGGTTKFMRKLGTGFTNYINIKYQQVGSLFQGRYKARIVKTIKHLQYLTIYIQILNPFELCLEKNKIKDNFDKIFDFGLNYQFCSLSDFTNKRSFSIIEKGVFKDMFPSIEEYKRFSKEVVSRKNLKNFLEKIVIN